MAWDTCRRGADPQPWTLRRPKSGVDELDFDRSNNPSVRLDMRMDLENPLSPIVEEEAPSETNSPPLQVKLTLRFLDPVVKSVYSRTYSSSHSFVPTDRICRGLLHRIQHCSEELITRKDSAALCPTQCLRKGPKDLRFEMSFQIYRRGYPGAWAERAFKSYQKQPLTSDSAMDLLRSTHCIIGIFLKRHDDHFQWIDEPSHEYFPDKPATFKPSLTGPLDLACVPRSRFIESTQKWEVLPGYTLELTLESRNPSRRRPDIRRTLKVDSTQTAPLTLGLGEDLLWQSYRVVEDALESRRNAFNIEHESCEGFDGVPDCGCQHFDEDALKVELRSINNLGPIYDHLYRNIQSRLRLFNHPIGQDCDEFVDTVRARLRQLRDRTDEKLELLNDFDFRIVELVGHGWHIKNPARFIIDGKQRYTRRSIVALLDRLRTGVGDVLRGHDVAIRMIAYKRGHLILDKALIARNHQSSPGLVPAEAPEDEQRLFVAQLTARIQKDIDMICKDTCSLEDIPELAPEPKHPARLRNARSCPYMPRPMSSQSSSHSPPGSPGLFTRPPVPPCVPLRRSSMRVFPLVPAKYKGKEDRPSTAPPSAKDSTSGIVFDSHHALGRAFSTDSSADVRVPQVIVQSHREDAAHGGGSFGLRPAAELKRARDEADDSNSSIFTYSSSLPALTESETPSPGQSMLITPNCVRDSSPQPSSLLFFNDADSNPLLMATSDPNIGHYPEPESLKGPKAAAPKPFTVPFGRPRTPSNEEAQGLASPFTPKASRGSDIAEASAVTRASQEARQASEDGVGPEMVMTGDMMISSALHDITASDSKAAGVGEAISPEVTQEEALPTEGWLLYCDEAVDEEDGGEVNDAIGVAQCDSSEALEPRLEDTAMEAEPKTALSGQQTHVGTDEIKAVTGPASEQADQQALPQISGGEDNTQSSGPTETTLFVGRVGPNRGGAGDESAYRDNVRDLPKEDEVSWPNADDHFQDEDTNEAESFQRHCPLGITMSIEPDLRLNSVTDVPETDHTAPFSDSVADIRQDTAATGAGASGSECEEHVVLGQIEEPASEARSEVSRIVLSGPETCATEPGATSDSSDARSVRDGTSTDPETAGWTPQESIDVPESPDTSSNDCVSVADQVTTLVPIVPPESEATSEVTSPLAQKRGFTGSVANSGVSLTHLGLGNEDSHPLTVSSNLGTGINQSRDSLSSSSEWEDYVSEVRRSIDSVDTVIPSPSPSEGDDDLLQPGHFGTPTAGLLGLHESRWVNFGIRGALTGTHAFDRASAGPLPHSPRHQAHRELLELKEDKPEAGVKIPHARSSSSQQRLIHLRHKKSSNSVVFPGAHIKSPKLNKKESKELKAREMAKHRGEGNSKPVVAENGANAERFPRAMMLVAGLAMVTTVVNKNPA